MSHPATSNHLARIEPLHPQDAGRVLSMTWKVIFNASLLLIPALLAGLIVPIFALLAWMGGGLMIFGALLIPMIFAAQIAWAGTYPEWPLNQWLVWRLRRVCRARIGTDPDNESGWIDDARMVEWVPQENWNRTKLDTANDVMLLRIDDDGVQLEGDFARYHFPSDSILDAQTLSVRPSGCFHRLHFVILTVRTEEGPTEFPLGYRDYRLGGLRSSKRHEQTETMAAKIRAIATGSELGFSDPYFEQVTRRDTSHAGEVKLTSVRGNVLNPYAAPGTY